MIFFTVCCASDKTNLRVFCSVASKNTVMNLLHEIEKLTDIERLFLYFKLPLGRSSDVDPLRM